MPLHTLMHGGLIHDRKHYPHGSEVELSTEEAERLNRDGLVVKPTALLKAEAEAEKKKAEHLAKLTAKIDADLKAESEAEKKKAGEKKGGDK